MFVAKNDTVDVAVVHFALSANSFVFEFTDTAFHDAILAGH